MAFKNNTTRTFQEINLVKQDNIRLVLTAKNHQELLKTQREIIGMHRKRLETGV